MKIYKKSNLARVDFSRSVLRGSRFFKSNLREAKFENADCSFVDFTKSSLERANFRRANLQHVSVYKSKMRGASLQEARLEGGELSCAEISECRGEKASFRDARLSRACLDQANFQGARFEGADLRGIKARKANFAAGTLSGANLEGAFLEGSDFSGADLAGANLKFASLKDVRMEGANLKNADFRFSAGLTKEERRCFKQRGAKTGVLPESAWSRFLSAFRSPWAWAAFFVFLLCLSVIAYFYLTDLEHLSIPGLQKRLRVAKQNESYERAVKINLALMRKFRGNENLEAVCNRGLDAASLYRMLGKKKESLEMLESLREYFAGDVIKTTRIKAEFVFHYLETGDAGKAAAILEDIPPAALENNYGFPIRLARAYLEFKKYKEAIAVCERTVEKSRHDPARHTEALRMLAAIYSELGEKEKSKRLMEEADSILLKEEKEIR